MMLDVPMLAARTEMWWISSSNEESRPMDSSMNHHGSGLAPNGLDDSLSDFILMVSASTTELSLLVIVVELFSKFLHSEDIIVCVVLLDFHLTLSQFSFKERLGTNSLPDRHKTTGMVGKHGATRALNALMLSPLFAWETSRSSTNALIHRCDISRG